MDFKVTATEVTSPFLELFESALNELKNYPIYTGLCLPDQNHSPIKTSQSPCWPIFHTPRVDFAMQTVSLPLYRLSIVSTSAGDTLEIDELLA